MTKDDRDIGRRWFEEVWNQGRREAIAEMLAPDAVLHEAGQDTVGPDGMYPFFDRMRASLTDLKVTVHDTITEGDCSCIRWSCMAKHTGPGLGIPPTGRMIHVTGISILRIVNGKMVEGWQNWDMLGMLEQIKDTDKSATYIASA